MNEINLKSYKLIYRSSRAIRHEERVDMVKNRITRILSMNYNSFRLRIDSKVE